MSRLWPAIIVVNGAKIGCTLLIIDSWLEQVVKSDWRSFTYSTDSLSLAATAMTRFNFHPVSSLISAKSLRSNFHAMRDPSRPAKLTQITIAMKR